MLTQLCSTEESVKVFKRMHINSNDKKKKNTNPTLHKSNQMQELDNKCLGLFSLKPVPEFHLSND